MPYFSWHGINKNGAVCKGLNGCQSIEHLNQELQARNIALLLAEKIKHRPLLSRVPLEHKVALFNQLSILLHSGIYLDKALLLLHEQHENLRLKEALYDTAAEVNEGKSLSQSLTTTGLFSPVMLHMIKAGEESGKLAIGLQNLADYLQDRHVFEQKVRGALMVPVLTFLFFLCIAITIFVFIVPSFATLFTGSGQKLPYITQLMLRISAFVTSKWIFLLVAAVGILILGLQQLARSHRYAALFDRAVLYMPFVGSLLQTAALSSFLQSLALLVQSSVHIIPALKMAQETINNSMLKERVVAMTEQIESGQTIQHAMQETGLFFNDARAMVSVGEESGTLGLMLQKATELYKHRVNKSVGYITTFLQPLLMIILGLLILGLVFAIYLPIFNLSNVVS